MPLPPRVHAAALTGRRGAAAAVMIAATAAALVAQPQNAGVTQAQLEVASGGRSVAVGSLSGGPVLTMPLEVYVARILAGEGEPSAPDAAQQALAIAIRTFAVFNSGRHDRDGFDLCDTTHCQVLRTSTATTRRAALATAGRLLAWQGRPAEVF